MAAHTIIIPPLNFTVLLPGMLSEEEEKIERKHSAPLGAAAGGGCIERPLYARFQLLPTTNGSDIEECFLSFLHIKASGRSYIVDHALASLACVSKSTHLMVCNKLRQITQEAYRNKDRHHECLFARVEEFNELEEQFAQLKERTDYESKRPHLEIKIDIANRESIYQMDINSSYRAIDFLIHEVKKHLLTLPKRDYLYKKRLLEENLFKLRSCEITPERRLSHSRQLTLPIPLLSSPVNSAENRSPEFVTITSAANSMIIETLRRQRIVDMNDLDLRDRYINYYIRSFKKNFSEVKSLFQANTSLLKNYQEIIRQYRNKEDSFNRFLIEFKATVDLLPDDLVTMPSETYITIHEKALSMINDIKRGVVGAEKEIKVILLSMKKAIQYQRRKRRCYVVSVVAFIALGVTLAFISTSD